MASPGEHSDHIFDVDTERFQREVIQASEAGPVLVDFWADWCAPCHALAPHLGRVVADLGGRVRLAKIEVDEGDNMKLAGRYQLRGFPTVILFHDGQELGRFSGARSRHQILDWLRTHLPDGLVGSAVS
ncbi:MAG: thioredoxin family protein [Thiocapsa sp.]|jgi:putative thioredoxin|nr:thioredoxin family protein [Thiocapsa sp.]MCG6896668.1 thioredoxin family protein [Thiocapsa sp.]MCG6984717.1 thioredoxin family protein [Thiocapsa sp.]